MKNITFFNCYHNGDIHVSRGFIRQIINKVKTIDPNIKFAYSHSNAPELLSDIGDLSFDPHGISAIGNDRIGIKIIGETTYINTWFGQQNYKFMNNYGISFDCLYATFDDTCRNLWGFSLEDISTDPKVFFPIIDYTSFKIDEAKKWLSEHPEKKIFISNGQTLSGQADNFPMFPIINKLSQEHPNITFILSNSENANLPHNIIYSSSIINKQGNDLNENAFLSENCDLIVGRASGTFSFAMTQKNMFERNITMLCFSNLIPIRENKWWLKHLLQDKVSYTANIVNINTSNSNQVKNSISQYL